jgi:signal transduction histidine kinase
MMPTNRRTRAALAVLGAVLVSALVFLYAKTRGFDESGYFGNLALLRQVKQLDAQWELHVLKSRRGIAANYDALVRTGMEMGAALDRFDADTRAQPHSMEPELAALRGRLRLAIRDKAELVEQFKSDNSVLRNSVSFLPTAASDLQDAIIAERGTVHARLADIPAGVGRLLLAGVLYSQDASSERGAATLAELSRLQAQATGLGAPARERLEIFDAHLVVILREQAIVNGLVASIAAMPTGKSIDQLFNLLSTEQRDAAERDRMYREYLLVFSGSLAALLLYAVLHVARSHSEINRVNHELKTVNERLEQRVHERTHELRQAQGELVSAAHMAGMAEIATNVLHNVGNVLNSVNVSAGLVGSILRGSRVKGLARAVRLMEERAGTLGDFLTRDPRGQKLPGYLGDLARALEQEHSAMAQELVALTTSVDHIKAVVATQSHAGRQRVVEFLDLPTLVDDAVRMNAAILQRKDIEVRRELAGLPLLAIERHRVLQILVNLISNAGHAMVEAAPARARIAIAATLDGARLRIAVSDNGEGIAAENLARVFAHGFTTRKDGHGFGLHSCVLAAREMGGSLVAQSAGPGLGATFVLEVPATLEECMT